MEEPRGGKRREKEARRRTTSGILRSLEMSSDRAPSQAKTIFFPPSSSGKKGSRRVEGYFPVKVGFVVTSLAFQGCAVQQESQR